MAKENIFNICFHVSAVELAIDTLRDSNENTYIKVTLPGKNFLQANDCQKILLKKKILSYLALLKVTYSSSLIFCRPFWCIKAQITNRLRFLRADKSPGRPLTHRVMQSLGKCHAGLTIKPDMQ